MHQPGLSLGDRALQVGIYFFLILILPFSLYSFFIADQCLWWSTEGSGGFGWWWKSGVGITAGSISEVSNRGEVPNSLKAPHPLLTEEGTGVQTGPVS